MQTGDAWRDQQWNASIPSRHLNHQLQVSLGAMDSKEYKRYINDGTVESMLRDLQQESTVVREKGGAPVKKVSWFTRLLRS